MGFDAHWEQALRYLRKKGMGTHRRGPNSESSMRLMRRLEKNHDGIRSAATRQHYIQIYQAMKYLSLDIAAFIEQGPHMPGLPRVFFQAEDGIRDLTVTGVQTCALPI